MNFRCKHGLWGQWPGNAVVSDLSPGTVLSSQAFSASETVNSQLFCLPEQLVSYPKKVDFGLQATRTKQMFRSPLSTSGHMSSESCCRDCRALSSRCGACSQVFSSLCVGGRVWLRGVVELGRHEFLSLRGQVFFTSPSLDFLIRKTR